MAYYFIANIQVTDELEYKKYLDGCGRVFERYRGTYLAADDDPLVLEGNWDYTRCVVIRFDTEDDFDAWYRSPEYQDLRKHRLAAAACDTVLVQGMDE